MRTSLLLLVWDVDDLGAVVASRRGKRWQFSGEVHSRHSDFALALGEVLALLRQTGRPPRQCCLAARFVTPAKLDIPIPPERPRPFSQMRDLMCAEIESAVSESGTAWTTGAILSARGQISPEERERIAEELATRRRQSGSAYFGQTAIDLGIINQSALQEASAIQEKLQTLESALACGWTGYREESGAPVWLACATGLNLWKQITAACRGEGLKLLGALPLAWHISEPDEAKPVNHDQIALEIHPEEIVAVLRRAGRIVAARSEGRMGRPLSAAHLFSLVTDWQTGAALEVVCHAKRDEPQVLRLLEEMGKPAYRNAAAARRSLYGSLARHDTLPCIRFGEPPTPAWKHAGFWHLACPLLVLAIITGIHVEHRVKIWTVQTRLDLADYESRRQTSLKQQEASAVAQLQSEREALESTRHELTKIMPDIERLQAIENMAGQLPLLLRALSTSIRNDVVLEAVRNSRHGGNMGDIMILAWARDYANAQMFALRVQSALTDKGYSLAQTEVTAGAGRSGQSGYFVSFWLLPRMGEELGLEEESRAAP